MADETVQLTDEEKQVIASIEGMTPEKWVALPAAEKQGWLDYYRKGNTATQGLFSSGRLHDLDQVVRKQYGNETARHLRSLVVAWATSDSLSRDEPQLLSLANQLLPRAKLLAADARRKSFEQYYDSTFIRPIQDRMKQEVPGTMAYVNDQMTLQALQGQEATYAAGSEQYYQNVAWAWGPDFAETYAPQNYMIDVARTAVQQANPDLPPDDSYVVDTRAVITQIARITGRQMQAQNDLGKSYDAATDRARKQLEKTASTVKAGPMFMNAIEQQLDNPRLRSRYIESGGAMTAEQFLGNELAGTLFDATLGTPYQNSLQADKNGIINIAGSTAGIIAKQQEIEQQTEFAKFRTRYAGKMMTLTPEETKGLPSAQDIWQMANPGGTATTSEVNTAATGLMDNFVTVGKENAKAAADLAKTQAIAAADLAKTQAIADKRLAQFVARGPAEFGAQVQSPEAKSLLGDPEFLQSIYTVADRTGEQPDDVLKRALLPYEQAFQKKAQAQEGQAKQTAALQVAGAIPFGFDASGKPMQTPEAPAQLEQRRQEAARVAALPDQIAPVQEQAASALGLPAGSVLPGGTSNVDLMTFFSGTPGYKNLSPQEQQAALAKVVDLQKKSSHETANRIDLQLPELENIMQQVTAGRQAAQQQAAVMSQAAATLSLPDSITGALDPGARQEFQKQLVQAYQAKGADAAAAMAGGEAKLGKSGVDALKQNLAAAQTQAEQALPGPSQVQAPPPAPVKEKKPAKPSLRLR